MLRILKTFRSLALLFLPPICVSFGRSLKRRFGKRRDLIIFEGNFSTWEEANASSTGYDAEPILAKVLEATLKVKRGVVAFERDSVVFDEIEYEWPVLSGLMWAAARSGGRLNVLDFGGALGSSYFQNRNFLQTMSAVRWNVVEQAHYVDAGRTNVQDERLRFYTTVKECLTENRPNLVLLSGVLQYLPEPFSILFELMNVNASVIVIDRTIVNMSADERIYVQQVPSSIYEASYPCRSISEASLVSYFKRDYVEIGNFQSMNFPALDEIESKFKGYIFWRKNS